jgi:cytochrome P450
MFRDYLGFTQGLQRAHGDISCLRIVREEAVDLHSPDLVRAAMVGQAGELIRWERGVQVFAEVFGQGLLVAEGAHWQRQRRLLQPGFAPRRVAAYAGLMVDAARRSLDEAVPPQASGPVTVDVDALLTRLTMDVILRTLFSVQASGDTAQAAAAVQVLSHTAMREMFLPFSLPAWWPSPAQRRKRAALRNLRGLIKREVQGRQALDPAAAPSQDLLAMLLSVRDDADGQGLAHPEVLDQCMVMFQAGHETTATALLWWCRLMAEHPEAAQRAQEEVDRVLAGRDPTPADLPALDWLGASLKEAMRLYPPVAVLMSRRTTQDLVLDGWRVARGAILRITPWVLHHDARWFPEPEAFRPQRFTADAEPPPKGAWMPFGTGPRYCIGQFFATLEMTLIAAMLLQRYRMALPAGSTPRPAAVVAVTLRPATAVHLQFARRIP